MADWNTLKYTGFDDFSSIALDTVNKLLYTCTGSTVLQWNPAAGTRTDIGTPAAAADLSMTFFRGAPYCCWFDGTTAAGVSRYSGGSWSTVYTNPGTISDTVEDPRIINLNDAVLLAFQTRITQETGGEIFVYSADGSNWMPGTIDGADGSTPASPGLYPTPAAAMGLTNYRFGFLNQQVGSAYFIGSRNPSDGGSACDICKWNGGNWDIEVSSFCTTGDLTSTYIQSRGFDKWWLETGGNHYWGNILAVPGGSWTLAAEEDVIFSAGQFNLAQTPGVRRAGQYLKWWDNDALAWEDDALLEGFQVTYGYGRFVFRFNDGTAYLITRNNGSTTNYLLARSENLSSGPSWPPAAQFYYGLNIPTYRSDLPVTGVNPGAMAINPAGNVAVLGGDEAGVQIAAYSSSPFTAWTDMSDGMTTGTPVTSVKYV